MGESLQGCPEAPQFPKAGQGEEGAAGALDMGTLEMGRRAPATIEGGAVTSGGLSGVPATL